MCLIIRKTVLLVTVMVMATSCAKKLNDFGDDGFVSDFGRRGDFDSVACDEFNEFYDIYDYPRSNFTIYDNGVGEFNMQNLGFSDDFSLTRNYIPEFIDSWVFVPPTQATYLGQMSSFNANVRVYLYNTCSGEPFEDRDGNFQQQGLITRVLRQGNQTSFSLSQFMDPNSPEINISNIDPYMYDVIAIEYVGQPGYQEFPVGRSPVWSAGCLHHGGFCELD